MGLGQDHAAREDERDRDIDGERPVEMGHVTGVAGGQVNMEMPDGLADGDADIEADVVAVRSVVLLDDLLGLLDREREGDPFVRGGGEPIGDMPPGNEKRAVAPGTLGNGEPVQRQLEHLVVE